MPITTCPLPDQSLLRRYQNGIDFVDCYTTTLSGIHTHAAYVQTFYCTRLFKLERAILSMLLRRPSSDAQAEQLALKEIDHFAAWRVEARSEKQLLLCDLRGQTRSWLMTATEDTQTRLYFGSAVVHSRKPDNEQPHPSRLFRLLVGFHKQYSIALLSSARSALLKQSQRS